MLYIDLNFSFVILFLKVHCSCNFLFREMDAFRCSYQFIFHIVMAMHYANNTSQIFFDRNIHPKQIHIRFFAIAAPAMFSNNSLTKERDADNL